MASSEFSFCNQCGTKHPPTPYKRGIAFNVNGCSADKDPAVQLGLVGSVQGVLNSSGDVLRVGGYNGNGLSLKPVQVDLRIDAVK
ncbi:MAG: hypothetical protein M3Z04_15940 [Chloroflexota bacterium]|nr:hypothetical protein [Chloroflexota bacterium]